MWILTAARREIKLLCVEEMEKKHKHGYEVWFFCHRDCSGSSNVK